MKRIAIVGAQGTGKTTIMKRVKDQLVEDGLRVEHVDETARTCPFKIDAAADFAAEFHMMTTQINEENLRELSQPDVLLTDRCVLDQMVYWSLVKEKKLGQIEQIPDTLEREAARIQLRHEDDIIRQVFDGWIGRFALILWVRVAEDVWKERKVADGFRSTDLEFYRALSERFRDTVDKYNLSVTVLDNDGALEEAVTKAVEIVQTALGEFRTRHDYEVELKFKLDEEEPRRLRCSLPEFGFEQQRTATEHDVYFHTDSDFSLRTRIIGNTGLCTLKGSPVWTTRGKVRREVEVAFQHVEEVDKFQQMLILLGYKIKTKVTKERDQWMRREGESGKVNICLDDVEGLGTFLEVEVVSTDQAKAEVLLESTRRRLGLHDRAPTRESYLDLVAATLAEEPTALGDPGEKQS